MQIFLFIFKLLAEGVLIGGILLTLFKLLLSKTLEKTIDTIFLPQQTKLVESIKKDFNESLESFKTRLKFDIDQRIEHIRSNLNRSNIDFQINQTEYVKRKFLNLEDLFSKAYKLKFELSRKRKHELYLSLEEVDFKFIISLVDDYVDKVYMSSFYLDEESRKILFQYSDRITEFIPVIKLYKSKKSHYDGLSDNYFTFSCFTDDGDVSDVTLSDSDISKMRIELADLKKLYENLKALCETDFMNVDSSVKKILYRPL